ncbi:nucleotide exchange factor GrpE [Candidatus Woesearchaeota archaeon]|nr:nucleotide exchange factor GrpE [Candidatus Woesearchaeota archaeon]
MKEVSKNKNAENNVSEAILEEKKDFLEDLKRVQADFENYIKRVEKEKEQLKLHAKSELLLRFIDIKEDFERALDKADEGVKMIYDNFNKILKEEGVKEIQAVGNVFNHVLHEAVSVADGSEDKVIDEIQKGYLLGDKVLRTSKVVIGKNSLDLGGN